MRYFFKALGALVACCMFLLAFNGVSFSESAESYDSLKAQIRSLIDQNKTLMERLKRVEAELDRLKADKISSNEQVKGTEGDEGGFLTEAERRIRLSGLLEFGAVYRNTSFNGDDDVDESDIAMTTVELDIFAKVNKWTHVTGVLLYEDPSFTSDETSFDVDSGSVIFGADVSDFTLTLGKVYVPFGALFTHFPDDPLIDSPLTLLLGETNEKAAILEYAFDGITFSTYVFNGDVEEIGEDENVIESYGFDIHLEYGIDLSGLNFYKRGEKFRHDPKTCVDFMIGASYISNLADSDFISDAIGGVIDDYVGGIDYYAHLEHCGYFIDAEFMGATDRFSSSILSSGRGGAKPYVWNIEAGFNYDWWKNLEVAFKIAGSHDAEALGFPEKRYGLNLNQDIFEGIVMSLGYIHDEYEDNDIEERDDRDLVFGQMAVEF